MSAQTKDLIEALDKQVSFWESTGRHRAKTLALIARAGEPAAIPYIARFMQDSNRKVAATAAEVVSNLFELLNPSELPWLDESMRGGSFYRWSPKFEWTRMKPRDVGRLQMFGGDSVFALGMASFHANGYVRGEALHQLEPSRDGRELPFLLLRVNDWVEPIRKAADRMIRQRLSAQYAPYFVLNIDLVRRLLIVQRAEQGEIVGAIERLLTSIQGCAAIQSGLVSPDRHVRATCYEIMLRAADVDPRPVIERALDDKDPAIRLIGAKRMQIVEGDEILLRLATRAKSDRFAPVRRTALEWLLTRFPPNSRLLLEEALMDSHPSIRGFAQFQLAQQRDYDLRARYLGELAQGNARDLFAAISGTGETGKPADVGVLIPHLQNGTPRIRRAAIRGIALLNATDSSQILLQFLSDPSPSVSREAKKGLSKILHLFVGEQLWNVFVATRMRHVRRNVLFLIARLSKWESIGYLAEAVAVGDEDSLHVAEIYVRRWYNTFNSSFMTPTEDQKTRLIAALQKSRGSWIDHFWKILSGF